LDTFRYLGLNQIMINPSSW